MKATATARRIGVCGPDELNSISNVAAAKFVRWRPIGSGQTASIHARRGSPTTSHSDRVDATTSPSGAFLDPRPSLTSRVNGADDPNLSFVC